MKILVFLLLTLLSTGCKDYECVRSHVVHVEAVPDQWVYWPASSPGLGITPYGAGIHIGGGMHWVPGHEAFDTTACDEWREKK